MEETKWLTKTKIIILISLLLIIGTIIIIIMVHRNNLRKEYIKYENQLEYAASNYLLKEKITLKENEWREINVSELLKQKLITNDRSSDCSGYVIANSLGDKNSSKEESSNIEYKAYIKCNKIYVTKGYGTKPSDGKLNTQITQTENDTEKPEITLFGDRIMSLFVGDKYEELGAVSIDNIDGDITKQIKISGSVDTNKAGSYTITYTSIDSSKNKAIETREVIVKEKAIEEVKPNQPDVKTPTPQQPVPNVQTRDTTKPIISFRNKYDAKVCIGDRININEYMQSALDNVDGDISSKIRVTGDTLTVMREGTYNLVYTVTDSAGNTAQAFRRYYGVNCETPKTTVIVSVRSIYVTPNAVTINVGSTQKLTVSISPSDATDKTVTFSSSNQKVATVNSNGVVTGKSKGTAQIRVTSVDGKAVGTCEVTVQ